MEKKDPRLNTEQLGNLLLRYKKIFKPPQSSVVKEAIQVIFDVTGLSVAPHQLEYTVATKTLFIKAPSILKNEIKQHHSAIKETLTKRLGEGNAPTTIL